MNHPNIVRLLEGGIADPGEACFVTEYVDGEAKNQYCDEKEAAAAKRIRLFLKVYTAAERAHHEPAGQ